MTYITILNQIRLGSCGGKRSVYLKEGLFTISGNCERIMELVSFIMLMKVEFGDGFVKIISSHHQFDLDLRKVDKEEIDQAKTMLKRTNFENRFELRII